MDNLHYLPLESMDAFLNREDVSMKLKELGGRREKNALCVFGGSVVAGVGTRGVVMGAPIAPGLYCIAFNLSGIRPRFICIKDAITHLSSIAGITGRTYPKAPAARMGSRLYRHIQQQTRLEEIQRIRGLGVDGNDHKDTGSMQVMSLSVPGDRSKERPGPLKLNHLRVLRNSQGPVRLSSSKKWISQSHIHSH